MGDKGTTRGFTKSRSRGLQTLFTLDPLGSLSRMLSNGSRVESDARALSVYGVSCLLYFPVYARFLAFLRLL